MRTLICILVFATGASVFAFWVQVGLMRTLAPVAPDTTADAQAASPVYVGNCSAGSTDQRTMCANMMAGVTTPIDCSTATGYECDFQQAEAAATALAVPPCPGYDPSLPAPDSCPPATPEAPAPSATPACGAYRDPAALPPRCTGN